MRGYNFTERVRKVLEMAREEAGRLNHEYLGTEHILLGLVSEGEGVAAAVLQNLQIDLDDVRESIERHVKKGIRADVGRDLPYTTRAKKVLELAMDEAGLLHHEYVGTEHLLLGLVREERGIAAQVLTSLGADLDSVRRETLRLLGTEMPQSQEPTARRAESHAGRPARFTIRIDYEGGSWSKNTFERAGDAIEFLRTYESPGSNGDDESAGATGPP